MSMLDVGKEQDINTRRFYAIDHRSNDDQTASKGDHAASMDADLADGKITEPEWFEGNRAMLEAAYLTAETPHGQSGSSGDATRWEQKRRVIAEGINRDGTFLDIGCANGLLMETIVEWAAASEYQIEPHGLDISHRLAALARQRYPAWSDRIHVGNAIDWRPPRRVDFVRTELEYVPASRRADLVRHLLQHVVAPGGRLIVCVYRSRGATEAESVGPLLQHWGFTVGGEATAMDPTQGGVWTHVAWLDMPPRDLVNQISEAS